MRWTSLRTWLWLGLLWTSPAWGLREFYSLSRTPRALGMGGAFYGLSDDEGALFYNPAGLALFERGVQIFPVNLQVGASHNGFSAFSTARSAFEGSDDVAQVVEALGPLSGDLVHANATVFPFFAMRGFAAGVLVGDVKATFSLLGRELDSELDATALVDSGLFVAKSFSTGKQWHWGVTAKFVGRVGGRRVMSVLDFVQETPVSASDFGGAGGGVDFDVGVQWAPSARGGVGVVLTNVLATAYPWFRSHGGPPGLPRLLSGGGFLRTGSLTWRLDLSEFGLGGQSDPHLGARTGSFFKHVHLGAEWDLSSVFQLRAGVHQGNWTAGLGMHGRVVRLDLATFADELGSRPGTFTSRRFLLRLALGYGAGPSKSRR